MADSKKISQDEVDLFRKEMERLAEGALKNHRRTEPKETDTNYEPLPIREPKTPVLAEDKLYFVKPGIQHTVTRKLKRGQIPCQAELDFHGLTLTEAGAALVTFLERCQQQNLKCVRIIHGKGHRSKNGIPALKNQVNQWLRDRLEVLAFCSAVPKEGGAGAVYVLLKNAN